MRPFLTKRRQLVVVGDVALVRVRVRVRVSPNPNPNPNQVGDVARLSHDVIRIRLVLPPQARVLGLPVGQHLKVTLTLTLTLTLTQTLTPNPNP